MHIAIVGGTGKEGRGLGLRWAKAGHRVLIGSRDVERAKSRAAEIAEATGGQAIGGDNASVAREAELVVLTVPFSAHGETLDGLVSALAGKILVDITVPLRPPTVTQVHLPDGDSAALRAQALLGTNTRVVATLHHVGSTHLADPDLALEGDLLVCGDDAAAKEIVLSLLRDLGARGLDAGPLRNSIALESLTPVLLHLNKRYGVQGAGIRITGLPTP
jgi:NADPH-dependent F420 reductase